MDETPYGATQAQWHHFARTLGLEDDLLPVVSNPIAPISEQSRMAARGKTPSQYNFRRHIAGIPKWTQHIASKGDIDRWQAEPDYGICIQTRRVRAIDIDIGHTYRSKDVQAFVERLLPTKIWPVRVRSNSGKRLMPFIYEGELTKRMIPTPHGVIEWLATGQQFVAAGAHIDARKGYQGVRYEWEGGLPLDLPVLDDGDVELLWEGLCTRFHDPLFGDVSIARAKRLPVGFDAKLWRGGDDDVAEYLMKNWEVYDVGADNQLYILCPFESEHSSDTGPTATAYFPAGTGGYQRGHFVCLHAHCSGRDDGEYLGAVGYSASLFDDLDADVGSGAEPATPLGLPRDGTLLADRLPVPPVKPKEWPRLVRDDKGRIEPTGDNLAKAIGHVEFVGLVVAYDRFKDEMMWAPEDQPDAWRTFTDTDYMRVRIALERRGFKAIGMELLRSGVAWVAHLNSIDTAQEWLSRLRWDGKPRIERFLHECMGADDTPYVRAVSRYIWTAHAGRVIEPAAQADMVPIYLGEQGEKKSSALAAMSPNHAFFAKLDMGDKDENLARLMRGKLVAELEELRGLNSRNSDSIKAWISRRWEEWVPKFKEFSNQYPRRLLLHGTTNEEEFLADDTGERRWLPLRIGVVGKVDIAKIKRWRDQLWAEGADVFAVEGVAYEDAETLAKKEHWKFKIADDWTVAVARWLDEPDPEGLAPRQRYVSSMEVAMGALGLGTRDMTTQVGRRLARILRGQGFTKHKSHGVIYYYDLDKCQVKK